MLNLIIEKLEQVEAGVQITGFIYTPIFFKEDPLTPEDQKAFELHKEKLAMYLALHLGTATISQSKEQ